MSSIVIADTSSSYNGRDLELRPLRGTETSVIRLARALARRGHQVTVYTRALESIENEGVSWRPLSEGLPESCDLYLPVHQTKLLGLVRRPKRLALWVAWPANQLSHYKRLPAMWWYRPIPVLMSLYQAHTYSRLLPRRDPQIVIPHGLPDDIRGLPPLSAPPPPHAIFASDPTRNLYAVVSIWAERILPKCPNAILDIYGVHGVKDGEDPWTVWGGKFLPANLSAAQRESIKIHPSVTRAELIAAMRQSRAMLYLGHKTEAFCLSVAEAQALGVPAVLAPTTCLPERIVDGVTGFLRSDPQSFADAAISLLSDDAVWRHHHEAALRLRQGISWSEMAARLELALLSDRIPLDWGVNDASVAERDVDPYDLKTKGPLDAAALRVPLDQSSPEIFRR
jgi:glycosyltransferase involved in cell wall biosynthesis